MGAKKKPEPLRVVVRGPKDEIPVGATEIVYVGGPSENRPQGEWKAEDGVAWYGRPQCCKMKRKSGGKRCGGRPTKYGPGDCCRMHGGARLNGAPIKHGLYSKKLLGLAARFDELRASDTILDTTADVALLSTITESVLEQGARFGDTPNFRIDAYKVYLDAQAAGRRGDDDGFQDAFRRLGNLLRSGYDIGRALNEAAKLSKTRATVAQRERQVQTSEERAFTEKQYATFVAIVMATIQREASYEHAERLLDGIHAALVRASAPEPRAIETA